MKYNNTNNKTIKTEWETKWFREGWAYPFGSMMNAYGQNFTSKGIDIKDFLSDSKKIFKLAKALVKDAYDFSQDIYEPEPVSMEQATARNEEFQKKYNQTSELSEVETEVAQVNEQTGEIKTQ
jgi:hypothetical protein